MRKNLPVTQTEYDYPKDWILLSTTDIKSNIKYANSAFCKVAGFEAQDLIGQPHNMVRHPDMPEAAFADLWQCVQRGDPWKGLVKNRCANGDFYWVDAFVTPITHNGEVVEYQSVRTKPSKAQVKRAEQLYKDLNEGKKSKAKPSLSLPVKLSVLFSIALLPMLYLAWQSGGVGLGLFAVSVLVGFMGGIKY